MFAYNVFNSFIIFVDYVLTALAISNIKVIVENANTYKTTDNIIKMRELLATNCRDIKEMSAKNIHQMQNKFRHQMSFNIEISLHLSVIVLHNLMTTRLGTDLPVIRINCVKVLIFTLITRNSSVDRKQKANI